MTSHERKRMDRIEFDEIVQVYAEVIPGADEVLARISGDGTDWLDAWPEVESDLILFLHSALAVPVMLPELRSVSGDAGVLSACFQYLEGLLKSEVGYVLTAVKFSVFEEFLESRDTLERAMRMCLPVTRSSLVSYLKEDFPATWRSLAAPPNDPDSFGL
ncbi:hypothetical protein ACFVDI_21110 [Nocardioides sp. NPDC057767]|uniref:hypothetical protein n=1 Tax=unclassified Nocardioides TaxID=2615069 RepID=UPI00366DE450